ncbi:glycosyltransferase 61 family protein [Sphingomonas faeni]
MYHLFHRDGIPTTDDLSTAVGQATRVTLPGSAPVIRQPPVFFAIDPRVADVAREHDVRSGPGATTRLAPSFVVALPHGAILTEGFLVADQDHRILSDSFRAFGSLARYGFHEHPDRLFSIDLVGGPELSGTHLVVGIQTNLNYFHWLLEAMPRLWLAQREGLAADTTVWLPPLRPWMADMLTALQPIDRCATQADGITRCARLLMPARGLSNIHTFCAHAFAMADEIRERHAPAAPAGRRFFITRAGAGSRKLINEAEIMEIAAEHGFETVEPQHLAFHDQVKLFAGADAIAGPLGAGLANAVFMRPGSVLIELAPEGREGDATLFANLAHHRQLDYLAAVGPTVATDARPVDRRDFSVDTGIIRKLFGALG